MIKNYWKTCSDYLRIQKFKVARRTADDCRSEGDFRCESGSTSWRAPYHKQHKKMLEPQTLKQYLTPGINDPLVFAAESHCMGSLTLISQQKWNYEVEITVFKSFLPTSRATTRWITTSLMGQFAGEGKVGCRWSRSQIAWPWLAASSNQHWFHILHSIYPYRYLQLHICIHILFA